MSDTYTTERGHVIRFRGIAALLDKLQTSHKMPDPPKYKIPTATGILEEYPLDEKSATTDEEKSALADYQFRLAQAQLEYYRANVRLNLMYGVEVAIPTDDTWVKRQEFFGITVPSDPLEREMHWRETELYGSPQDLHNILLGVSRASGTDEETLSQMAESFRRSLGQRNGREIERPSDTADAEGVVLQSEV